jgi:hypothetical protein
VSYTYKDGYSDTPIFDELCSELPGGYVTWYEIGMIEWERILTDASSVEHSVDSVDTEPAEVLVRLVEDGFGSQWFMCQRLDCDLHVVRVGCADCHHPECPDA